MIGRNGLVQDAIASASLRIFFGMIVVDGHEGVELYLDVCNFRIVDVVLVNLF